MKRDGDDLEICKMDSRHIHESNAINMDEQKIVYRIDQHLAEKHFSMAGDACNIRRPTQRNNLKILHVDLGRFHFSIHT